MRTVTPIRTLMPAHGKHLGKWLVAGWQWEKAKWQCWTLWLNLDIYNFKNNTKSCGRQFNILKASQKLLSLVELLKMCGWSFLLCNDGPHFEPAYRHLASWANKSDALKILVNCGINRKYNTYCKNGRWGSTPSVNYNMVRQCGSLQAPLIWSRPLQYIHVMMVALWSRRRHEVVHRSLGASSAHPPKFKTPRVTRHDKYFK